MSAGVNLDVSNLLNPLSSEQIAALKTQVAQEPLLRDALQRAASAGIDVSDALQTLDEEMAKAKKLLEVYG